jgi:hypothetical protein
MATATITRTWEELNNSEQSVQMATSKPQVSPAKINKANPK